MNEPYKRLYRSRNERMIAGVAGGLAEYLNIDPTVVRLLFVLTAIFGGPGLIAYIIMALVIPEEPGPGVPPPPPTTTVEPPSQSDVI